MIEIMMNNKIFFICNTTLHLDVIKRILEEEHFQKRFSSYVIFFNPTGSNTVLKEYFYKLNISNVKTAEISLFNDNKSFLSLNIFKRWFYVTIAKRQIKKLILTYKPFLCVLQNDIDLINRTVIKFCRIYNVRTMLIVESPLLPYIKGRNLIGKIKFYIGKIIESIGFYEYGTNMYGCGSTDVICVPGIQSKILLEKLGVNNEKIFITGQPRYIGILNMKEQLSFENKFDNLIISFFTTNIYSGMRDEKGHIAQIKDITDLYNLLENLIYNRFQLWVKIHPSDRLDFYNDLKKYKNLVIYQGSSDSYDIMKKSEILFINFSTSYVEALLIGVPCVIYANALVRIKSKYYDYKGLIHTIPLKRKIFSIKELEKFLKNFLEYEKLKFEIKQEQNILLKKLVKLDVNPIVEIIHIIESIWKKYNKCIE
ncbi:MAG: hypothetical protein QXX45_03445 [Candidatus Aenigmatarchaeota archaeon]